MKHIFSSITLLIVSIFHINAQAVVTLQPGPDEGKDATIWTLEPTINYGDFYDFIAATWTWSGDEGTYRSLLEFNLDTIPQGSEITCASLSLYYNDMSGTNGQEGENESIIQRVTSAWSEDVVTWNTMPTTTAVHEITLPTSTFISEDYLDLDVTEMVADMIADPANSHGFMISLTTEETYSSMKFCSSDYAGDPANFPKLEICYNAPLAVQEINNSKFSIGKNPINDQINVLFHNPVAEGTYCMLTDMNGAAVIIQNVGIGAAEITIPVPVSLPSGIYSFSVIGSDGMHTVKLLKL